MALSKVITQDKIEIVGDFKAVQVRTKTAVLEDGVELSSSFHRAIRWLPQTRCKRRGRLLSRVYRSTSYLCGSTYRRCSSS